MPGSLAASDSERVGIFKEESDRIKSTPQTYSVDAPEVLKPYSSMPKISAKLLDVYE